MEKKIYSAPRIEIIFLDNEISLALESSPPLGPDEANIVIRPEYFNNNPIRTSLG
jgi:hypothetical protein